MRIFHISVLHRDLNTSRDFHQYAALTDCKFLYNKTNQMHQFPKFTSAWYSTCFGQFLCPSSGVYSLYTRHWYMSCKFEDRVKFHAEVNLGNWCICLVLLYRNLLRRTVTWTYNLTAFNNREKVCVLRGTDWYVCFCVVVCVCVYIYIYIYRV
jgi:hypothetical protein